MEVKEVKIDPWVRVAVMMVGLTVIVVLARLLTGEFLPTEAKDAIAFQNALLLIVLGSAILEHHFTKPADSVVNSLMGLITLLSVAGQAPRVPWTVVFIYCGVVFVLATICVAVSSGKQPGRIRERIARLTYRPAVVFGRSRILFSVVFLASLSFFHSVQSATTISLVLFWGLFIAIWPLHLPQLVTAWWSSGGGSGEVVGEISRIDNPDILRVRLSGPDSWEPSKPKIAVLPDGSARWVQPLYMQFQEGHLLATGLLTGIGAKATVRRRNCVIQPDSMLTVPSVPEINASLGGGKESALIGFVVEKSGIGAIQFETLDKSCCHEGMLVWCFLNEQLVYYQVIAGETREESFAADKHGFQVATAVQLGRLEEGTGFDKFEWLPAMNTPVFTSPTGKSLSIPAVLENDFVLGTIPKTHIKVGGNFVQDYNHHTAILGVTGSGKTELAFDIIRHAIESGIKVVCIDLTAQYKGRLTDCNPVDLAIDSEDASELEEKLFAVETGPYSAQNEKKALSEYATTISDQLSQNVQDFLGNSSGSGLGLFRLEEIANTKATLSITELFLTCLLKYAREHRETCPQTLIVVEEAHTVMPEASTMGLADFDSKGLVGKIAQVALQGRKFGVGLLVLAQRTATVSKTVLTQCNTIISFACYDDTSLSFLRNIYGPSHVSLIPNLPRLHAVAFGPWIRSQHPIVFQVPFKEALSMTAGEVEESGGGLEQ